VISGSVKRVERERRRGRNWPRPITDWTRLAGIDWRSDMVI
jgi:hypothetical protein